MQLEEWLQNTTHSLQKAAVQTPRLDALVLLGDALKKDKAWLLAHPEHEISPEVVAQLERKVACRRQHEPLTYIRCQAPFYGRDFSVNPDVLVPRPESEQLIDYLLALPEQRVIADIGTGSGALAVTAALELPACQVYATDISQPAMAVARRNAAAHDVTVTFLEGDLLAPLAAAGVLPDVLLCNLPYVPTDYEINRAAGFEPELALFAGKDGLQAYRTLFGSLSSQKPAYILCEALSEQHHELTKLAQHAGYSLQDTAGLVQVFAAS